MRLTVYPFAIVADIAAAVTAVSQISSGQANPYLVSFLMGLGFSIPIIGVIWTRKRDRRAEQVDAEQKNEQAKKWHAENRTDIHAAVDGLGDLRKLIEGRKGLLAEAEVSEWRRHQLRNVMVPVLNNLASIADVLCVLCEKAGVRFRAEVAEEFLDAARQLQKEPPRDLGDFS